MDDRKIPQKQNRSFLYFLVFAYLFSSCQNSVKENSVKDTTHTNYSSEDILTLKKQVLKGDTMAYERLMLFYMEGPGPVDFLPYAVIMANKFGDKYKKANYDVFFCMQAMNDYYGRQMKAQPDSQYVNVLDSASNQVSIKYLMKYRDNDTAFINQKLKYYRLKP